MNAEIQGDEMVLKHYYDIGIAVGAEEGLVVPVLRDADRMSFAEIEKAIGEFVGKAETGKLSIADLRGGAVLGSGQRVDRRPRLPVAGRLIRHKGRVG